MVKLLVTWPEVWNSWYEFCTWSDLPWLRKKHEVRLAVQWFIDRVEWITSSMQMDLFPENSNWNRYVNVEVDDDTFSKLIHWSIIEVENFIARILILSNSDKRFSSPTLVERSKKPEQENLPDMFSLSEMKEAA